MSESPEVMGIAAILDKLMGSGHIEDFSIITFTNGINVSIVFDVNEEPIEYIIYPEDLNVDI